MLKKINCLLKATFLFLTFFCNTVNSHHEIGLLELESQAANLSHMDSQVRQRAFATVQTILVTARVYKEGNVAHDYKFGKSATPAQVERMLKCIVSLVVHKPYQDPEIDLFSLAKKNHDLDWEDASSKYVQHARICQTLVEFFQTLLSSQAQETDQSAIAHKALERLSPLGVLGMSYDKQFKLTNYLISKYKDHMLKEQKKKIRSVLTPEYLKEEGSKDLYEEYVHCPDTFIATISSTLENPKYALLQNHDNIITAVKMISLLARDRKKVSSWIGEYDWERGKVNHWKEQFGLSSALFWLEDNDLQQRWVSAKGNESVFQDMFADIFLENYKVLVGSFLLAKETAKQDNLFQTAFDFDQHCTPSMTRPIASWVVRQTQGRHVDELEWEASNFIENDQFLENIIRTMLTILKARFERGELLRENSRSAKVNHTKYGTFENYLRSLEGVNNVISKLKKAFESAAYQHTLLMTGLESTQGLQLYRNDRSAIIIAKNWNVVIKARRDISADFLILDEYIRIIACPWST